jgi:hypothetical protein
MNAYNQENTTDTTGKPVLVGTVNKYQSQDQGESNTYALLIKKYSSDVQGLIVNILRKEKKMSEQNANTFCDNMFSLGDKRQKDIANEVRTCYDEGKTKKQCAQQLVNKYYKITKVNKYQNNIQYQTNREVSGEGETTEVSEKVKYEQFKRVSISLFWNFIERINDLELKFNLDTSIVRGLNNSLNTQGYVLYMTTKKINNREVEYEFKHSKILSNILSYIMGKESENETSFYLGFDGRGQLHFGFIINDKKYKIGYTNVSSYDFQKLTPYISADKSIDLIKLSRKFVSNIESLDSIRTILNLYLDKYEDDIVIYNAIINNNFGIIIESLDDEVVSQQYIEEIIRKYVKISHFSNWYVEKMKSGNKTFYYFILK